VTSVRGTFATSGTGTVSISLYNLSSNEPSLDIRPLVVGGNSIEVNVRNDRRVMHSQAATGDTLMTAVVSLGTFLGVLNVSVLGVF